MSVEKDRETAWTAIRTFALDQGETDPTVAEVLIDGVMYLRWTNPEGRIASIGYKVE